MNEPARFPSLVQPHMLHGQQRYVANLAALAQTHAEKWQKSWSDAYTRNQRTLEELTRRIDPQCFAQDLNEYLVDLGQRQVLFLDCLRRRGDLFLEHEEVGARPVLAFEYETIVDGATLPRPVNYSLVRIIPPEGTPQRETGRPYVIIDPRAGHGSGIGGFKDESEVGCALRGGHPVYFVVFSRHPKDGQTLADVCTAEAAFVREVRRRHPRSPKPIIIGNCQGGWATMLLAATNPDITGPIVANGAPLSYCAGQAGKYPMRYLGGLYGGILPALILSDMGNGLFDGANLVLNFEMLHPGRTWWTKHFDAFSAVDTDAERYLDFERWWGSFYYMSEAEIRWIIGELFIGNKLARGLAHLDERTHVDLRDIQSPIIIFASHGDNITPPQQALNWIADLYQGVDEIRVRGQRIIYTIHENVGHLGIFVSRRWPGRNTRPSSRR
jgi:pimeloyl-ACP methyl ester carboxylesterase